MWASAGGGSPEKGSLCLRHWFCHQHSVALRRKKQPYRFPGQDTLPGALLTAGQIIWGCLLPPFACTKSMDQTFVRTTCLLSLHLFLSHWNICTATWQSTQPVRGAQSAECASAAAKPVSYLAPGSLSPDSFMADTKEESIEGQGVDISFSKKWSIEDQSPSSVYQPWEMTFFFNGGEGTRIIAG